MPTVLLTLHRPKASPKVQGSTILHRTGRKLVFVNSPNEHHKDMPSFNTILSCAEVKKASIQGYNDKPVYNNKYLIHKHTYIYINTTYIILML